MEDQNFGWSKDQFLTLQKQIQQGNNGMFWQDLAPEVTDAKRETYRKLGLRTKTCLADTTDLLCGWLKESEAQLSEGQRKQVKTALLQALPLLEQEMASAAVVYGDLKGWLSRKAFEAVKKTLMAQNFGWTPDTFLALRGQIEQGDASVFRADLVQHLENTITYVKNLARKKSHRNRLEPDEDGWVTEAVINAFTCFEGRMDRKKSLRPLRYDNLNDWLVGNAADRFKRLWAAEQKLRGAFDLEENRAEDPDEEHDLMVSLIAKTLEKIPDEAKYFYRTTLELHFWKGLNFEKITEFINEKYANFLDKAIIANSLRKKVNDKVYPMFRAEFKKICAQFGIFDIDIDLTNLTLSEQE